MKRRFATVLAAFFLLYTAVPCGFAEAAAPPQAAEELDRAGKLAEATPALKTEQIVIYNNVYKPENPCCPMVYVTGLSLMGTGFTVRVYDSSNPSTRKLIACHEVEDTSRGFTVELPAAGLSPEGGAVYVTLQQAGMAESTPVRADYLKAAAPSASLDVIKIDESYSYEKKEFANGWPLNTPEELKQDSYYLVDVKLRNFHTVGGVTIPVRYNTDYLELVPVSPSTKLINQAGTVSADEGAWFNFAGKTGVYRASLQCGILPGFHSDYGTVGAVDDYPIAKGSDLGEYPYVNTATGLIKLEIMKNRYGTFDYRDGNWKAGVSIVRLVFRAKQDGTGLAEMKDLVHFAAAADYLEAGGSVSPSGKPDDSTSAARYYATQHPAGISVTLEDAQLLRTPPSLEAADSDFPEDRPLDMTAQDIVRLPESFEEKATTLSLPENSIKIYNYTNSSSFVNGLDAYLPDRLVLSPSSETGGVIYGDCISVYGDSSLNELLGEGTADPEGAVSIDLGSKLDAAGGRVYVTNRRAGVTSKAVAYPYPKEAARDVTFRIYRTAMPDGVTEGADPRVEPKALQGVKQGEQFQIKIYFNDINDLMGYTFPIHFNTLAVKAADQYFRPIQRDGYLTEADFFNGRTPFSVGADICELTTTELIIYYAQESEIPGLMEQLGISSREEWDKRKQDIQVKIEFGTSHDGGIWNGGLLFTGPRTDESAGGAAGQADTAYPYVNNNSASLNTDNGGLVKLWATSLTSPMSRLERDGGYHFLSLNFTGATNVASESAGFRFADKNDGVYDMANPEGGRLVLSGPEESAGRNVNFHWEVYSMDEIPIPAGTTVGGIITSWNPQAETTVTLLQNGETVQTVTCGGAAAEGSEPSAKVPAPSAAVLGASAEGPDPSAAGMGAPEEPSGSAAERPGTAEHVFRFTEIMPGTYTVRIQKESHVDVIIEGLKVEETELDLSQHADPRLRRILLPCGDVTGDGHIGLMDREMLLLSKYYGKAVASLAEEDRDQAKRLDLDGDGYISKKDLQILMSASNYGKSTVHIHLEE